MSDTQRTHWDGCVTEGGPKHYDCAVARIRELEAELSQTRAERDEAIDAADQAIEIARSVDSKDRDALRAELDRRIEALEREQEGEWPQVGDKYYFVDSCGGVKYDCRAHDNDKLTALRKSIGNVYRTEAEAKRGHLAATAIRLLRQWADEDRAAHPGISKSWRCFSDEGGYVGPCFVTSTARDRAQAALTKEQLEALV